MNDEMNIKVLLEGNYITAEELEQAKKHIAEKGGTMVDYFFSKGLISKEILGQAMAEKFNILFVDLDKEKIDVEVLE
ncbi:MAG: hypothetical protein WC894_06410, partial [Patescibacteria group bacterium]